MAAKRLFITGASSGIGAASARAAVEAGWKVGLFARSADKLSALVEEFGEETALALPGDAAAKDDQEKAMAAMAEAFGGIDAAFANAGLGASSAGFEGGDPDNWRQMIEVNIWGALMTAKLAIPHLRKTTGHFLVTGSRAGRATLKGSVYGATKWFIHGWATNLAEELREWGGRTTVISPGMVDTPFFDDEKPDGLRPEDIGRAVLYAISQPPSVDVREVHVMPNPQGG